MSTSVWQKLSRMLTRQSLVSPPSVWGKLPTHGDFVHHRASMAEREAWHAWVQTVWPQRPQTAPRRRSRQDGGWMTLDVPPSVPLWQEMPVAFVLPPGSLAFAPSHHVQGVLVPSTDKVGRACPFIVYQKASPAWMQRLWADTAVQGGQHLLYWWARLAWCAVQDELPLPDWLTRLDAVWAAHEPGWTQWLGAPPPVVDSARIQALLQPLDILDPAEDLRGVSHLPWADWPQRCLRAQLPHAAFWTQDAEGGYLQAGESLPQLWGRA